MPAARLLVRVSGAEHHRRIGDPEDRWKRDVAPTSCRGTDAPEAERAELAQELVMRLAAPTEAYVADEWDKELLRRLAEIDAGTATRVDREAFRRQMQARLGNR